MSATHALSARYCRPERNKFTNPDFIPQDLRTDFVRDSPQYESPLIFL